MTILNATQAAAQFQLPRANSTTLVNQLGDSFAKILEEVNALQIKSDAKIEEFATSPDKDLHGTMIAMQKADISMRLLLQVRSKVVNAYNEIMRMQF